MSSCCTIQLLSVPGAATTARMKKCTSTLLPITADKRAGSKEKMMTKQRKQVWSQTTIENIPPQSMDVTLMKLPQWIQRWRMKILECAFLKLSSLNQLIVSRQFSMTLSRLIMPTIVVLHQKHKTIKIWFLLFIEGTHKTNNKTFPLFTVGICDENFKMNVILWVLCLNEWA